MITTKHRILTILLITAMLISLFPVVSMAEEPVDQWKQISFADIKETDSILITMKVGSKYYMITTDRVTSGAPLAFEATVNTDGAEPLLKTTKAAPLYGWNFIAAEGGYHIKSTVAGSENYLSIGASDNKGVRIYSKTATVWTLDGTYLSANDPGGTLRYLGVYKSTDWRSYTNTNNNIADQEAVFWTLANQGIDPNLAPKAAGVAVSLEPNAYLAGTEIVITSKEDGASVFYHTGDENWTEHTDPIVLTESMTITAKSVKEGMRDSDPQSFAYTAFTVGEEIAVRVKDMSELASGDRIIIVAEEKDRSLGKNQRNNNRDVGYVIKDGDTCTFSEETQVLTLEAGITEDTYSFYAQDGNFSGYLYVPMDAGNFLRSNEEKDENASFHISINDLGQAIITGPESKLQNTIFYYHGSVKVFSCYASTSSHSPVAIYKLEGQERPGIPEDGDVVAIYNLAARGVLSDAEKKGNNSSISTVPANIVGSTVYGSNGTLLFNVEKSGDSYRFRNEAFGYLCAGGSSAYYSEEATHAADWELEPYNGGYLMFSQAVPEHTLQFTSGKFAAYNTNQAHTRDGLTYHFFPCINEEITAGVVNMPQVIFGSPSPAIKGQSYQLNFSVDAIFGVKELHAYLGSTELSCNPAYGRYSTTVPAELVTGETLTITVKGKDTYGVDISGSVEIIVKDEPLITDVQPIPNSQTKGDLKPTISAKISNAGVNPTVTMIVNDMPVNASYQDGIVSYTPQSNLKAGTVRVSVTVTRQDGKTLSKNWSFIAGYANFTLLFGQLHSHTGEYSDGSGTLQSALEYIDALPEEANVDFVAFTDHSNYFDTADAPNPEDALYDLSLASPDCQLKWTTYKNTMAEFNKNHAKDILALPGFEMTWSGGPGHMNTFVTEGIVSRNNKTLNNKSADAGMRAYYELLTREEGADGITQLNHPGTSFGNFTDFAYWNPEADSRVYLVEVGNGEGPIRGGGYYPSYEQYNLALDKGWHVAPTNNQDNHKGKWGNANNARDVILAENFTEESIYDAIRSYRVYATEDKNLEIGYTVNDLPMGTMIETVPDVLDFNITLKDPDSGDSVSRVDLIVNSGKVAYTWDDPAELASGKLTAKLAPSYSYYYVRVTQTDKDIAVTAPVWVGESLKLGIREAKTSADIAVVGEELSINTTFYNEEAADAAIKSIVYTVNGSEVLHTDNDLHLLSAGEDVMISWKYTPTEAKLITITITAIVDYNNQEYTFTSSVELNVELADQVTYLGIDASHFNEYVTGKYSQMMNHFTTLATEAGIRCNQLNSSTALISACKNEQYSAIVLNVPSRQLSQARSYTQQELDALKEFNARGGILIISNLADKLDKLDPHMAATQNALLEALGSSLRFADDSVRINSYNTVKTSSFGTDPLNNGCKDPVVFYNGSSVYAVGKSGNVLDTLPSHVSGVLYGTYSAKSQDIDEDGLGGASAMKYSYDDKDYGLQSRLLLMAAERQEGKGMIFVSGAPFMNDYNTLIPAENGNNVIVENLLNEINPVMITPIAEVRKETEVGYKFNIEGVVTSNASGFDKDTAFFDCIYVQDETAGINCFPVAGNFKIGDIVQIKGQTEFYIGEPELQVQTIEKLGETTPIKPVEVTAAQINDRSVEGSLITLNGVVTKITMANGLVESIYIKDAQGDVARAFIDGYITSAKTIPGLEQGCSISVTGIGSYDNTYAIEHDSYARIRVRDRGDIITSVHTHTIGYLPAVAPTCTERGLTEGQYCTVCEMVLVAQEVIPATGHSYVNNTCTVCGSVFPFIDVPENVWYRKAVEYVYDNKLMNGLSATTYGPDNTLTRAMLVTILYRMAGSPEVEQTGIFADVSSGTWYSNAIQWGYDNNIVKGMAANIFAPNQAVSREQMVTFLFRYAKYAGYDVSKAETTDLSAYVDVSSVSAFASESFRWAVGEGVVNGMGDNTLAPKGTATRAQIAQVIMKFDKLAN